MEDIAVARTEMEAQDIEFIGPIEVAEDGNAWSHFRALEGFIYELIDNPERSQKEDI